MDGDTQSMATAKPSRTRKQPSEKPLTPAQKQLQKGKHLKKRCKLWAPTWQKEVGWAPEAGLNVPLQSMTVSPRALVSCAASP